MYSEGGEVLRIGSNRLRRSVFAAWRPLELGFCFVENKELTVSFSFFSMSRRRTRQPPAALVYCHISDIISR